MSKLWGGRFKDEKVDKEVLDFTSSLSFDNVLAKYDALSTRIHVEMLSKCGYLKPKEKDRLVSVIGKLEKEIEEGKINFKGHEDIHSAIQSYVESHAPGESKKMHTARSRNEQVVNDVRLYCKDKIAGIIAYVSKLQEELINKAEKSIEVIIAGYTHLNRAQPILFSHLLLAYVEMLERDKKRLKAAIENLDISVMGSGAIAGSSLNLDRDFTAEKLGFGAVSSNSIDSVSDRDFIMEILSGIAITGVHLSRISEDFILYSTSEFGYIDISEEFCTGSSLMPQKKNADVLELIRGKAAQLIGALNSLFILVKGLPHAYNRDLQDDKKFLFESVNTVTDCLKLMARVVKGVTAREHYKNKNLEEEFIYSTDIAEYLVRKGIAFSEAHRITGEIVRECLGRRIDISDLTISDLRKFSNIFNEDVYELLNPETSVTMKKTYGSTNPGMVKKEISLWKKRIGKR